MRLLNVSSIPVLYCAGVRVLTTFKGSFREFLMPFLIGSIISVIVTLGLCVWCPAFAAEDPLPSWNEGGSKKRIFEFVQATTTPGSPEYVPDEERIATFDQDGTILVEQPFYVQGTFAMDRVLALSGVHPEWKSRQPYAAIIKGDPQAQDLLSKYNIEKVIATTPSGMSVEAFDTVVKDWLASARHPRFNRPYPELVYQPMRELMQYLRDSGFKTYIVTGGPPEFVRVLGAQAYGVLPQQVIGSPCQTKFVYAKDGKPALVRCPVVLWSNDRDGKVMAINLVIGRRPVAAFGNSNGDRQMLEWTQAGGGARLMMLVQHDDPVREYAYGADSKVGNFGEELLKEAKSQSWNLISMKNDWKRIFAW